MKPEPRKLPNRPHPVELPARQMPEPTTAGGVNPPAAPLPRHPHKRGGLARFMMMLVFLAATVALVFGILTVLKQESDKAVRPESPASPAAPGPEIQAPPRPAATAPQPEAPAKKTSSNTTLPTPAPEQPVLIEPVPDLPPGMEPKAPGIAALEVLEKFLKAKSLAERLPMMETKTPEPELAASCLAGTLPPAPSVLLEFQESNPMEEVVDFYYSVDFDAPGRPDKLQTILVRTRGRAEPKVVADPFLDLFGGRLAAYATQPSDKAGVFQVIASPLASCNNPKIPNREKKLTLKLLARENAKEIAQAYFGKLSKIGEMLEDGTYSLSYGKAKACTVMLRWNIEDDPKNPYLEAIAIKAQDWNP